MHTESQDLHCKLDEILSSRDVAWVDAIQTTIRSMYLQFCIEQKSGSCSRVPAESRDLNGGPGDEFGNQSVRRSRAS